MIQCTVVFRLAFFVVDYCRQDNRTFHHARLLLGWNRISMIVWSWNSLYDLGNDRELYFSAHRDTWYVLDGVMDFIKNDCLCDPCMTRRTLMNAVAPSNPCTYWPSAEDWKTTRWCTVQRPPGWSSYIFFSEEKIMGYRLLKWLQDPLTNLIVVQTQMKNHGALLI